ncbi:MAG TPA: hypothetical protein VJY65_09955 [Chloroflexota bacterium]|nr:hypothetical protein [Chloroflexota bacterium]
MSPSSAFTARHCGHALLGVAAPSARLPAHSLVAPATHATSGGCRLDLVVTLSNGDTFDLHTTVTDVYTGFQLVSNARHIAVGTSVTSAVPTSVLDPQDTFQFCAFYADEPPGTCSADTKVDTPTPQIAAAATTGLVSVNGTVVATASASGQGRQMLWTNFSG